MSQLGKAVRQNAIPIASIATLALMILTFSSVIGVQDELAKPREVMEGAFQSGKVQLRIETSREPGESFEAWALRHQARIHKLERMFQ